MTGKTNRKVSKGTAEYFSNHPDSKKSYPYSMTVKLHIIFLNGKIKKDKKSTATSSGYVLIKTLTLNIELQSERITLYDKTTHDTIHGVSDEWMMGNYDQIQVK